MYAETFPRQLRKNNSLLATVRSQFPGTAAPGIFLPKNAVDAYIK
jgi:hypothetical protein